MADLSFLRQQLEAKEDVCGCLENLNTRLAIDTSASLVSEVLSTVSLPLLFSCLQTDDREQLRLTCAVLDKMLCHLPASELVKHGHYVELGLQYPGVKVAKTCLQALLRLSEEKVVEELILAPTMLHLVTKLLGEEDLQCASLAGKLLLHFSTRHDVHLGVLFVELEDLLMLNDTVRYRVYDLLVQTCLQGGTKCFLEVRKCGYLEKLVGELETNDPLVKMNCIELLSHLTESDLGVNFLQSSEVLKKLYQVLTASEHDVVGAIVLPATLKFFGQLCLSLGSDAVELFEKYPRFLQLTLEAVLASPDETLWNVSVDTFGLLCSNQSGRTLLASQKQATGQVLRKLGELIAFSPSEVRCRAMRAVGMMVSCVEDCSWEQSISQQWFTQVHSSLFQLLLSIVHQPFADLRLAGLMVMVELSFWEWGQHQMQTCPGFLEYLLDRSSESDKQGRELKYEIVCRIVQSECGEAVWGKVDIFKIKKYHKEGPFYYSGNSTVAIEGAS